LRYSKCKQTSDLNQEICFVTFVSIIDLFRKKERKEKVMLCFSCFVYISRKVNNREFDLWTQ